MSALTLDGDRNLLEQSFRLRYQVYCLERHFLPADAYPNLRETDQYDSSSVHVGAVDPYQRLVGTARLITLSTPDLPLWQHCELFPEHRYLLTAPGLRIVEVSRVCVSRHYRRAGHASSGGAVPRRTEVMLTALKAMYQACRRLGATHWISASEQSMLRLLAAYALPIRPIGPSTDYFGPVQPCLGDLREFDQIIRSGRVPDIADFNEGLDHSLSHTPVTHRLSA